MLGPKLVIAMLKPLTEQSRRTVVTQGNRIDALPGTARQAFARALSASLLASSYSSLILGPLARWALDFALTKDKAEVAQPEQIVMRLGREIALGQSPRTTRHA